jgi:GR25 family glycosyltransferase involved in LPS biosynthesis
MKLFDRFDKVFLINLKKRTDRLNDFIEQVNKFDLGKFEIFEAYDLTDKTSKELDINFSPGAHGLITTNIEILKKSIEENYQTICIIEDDCFFKDNISEIDTYYNFLPSDWDILYFGGNHNHSGGPPPIKINEHVIKLQHTYTTHFVCIKRHMFEGLIEEFSKFICPIDLMYLKFQRENNVYCFNPGICSQSPGFSDISGNNTNYLDWID